MTNLYTVTVVSPFYYLGELRRLETVVYHNCTQEKVDNLRTGRHGRVVGVQEESVSLEDLTKCVLGAGGSLD